MTESVFFWTLAVCVSLAILVRYTIGFRRRLKSDRERKLEATHLGIDRPRAQYPFVDASKCIGCGACVEACPEGDPLGVVAGLAVVINGLRCVGHGYCETACPVGAIEVGLGDLKGREDIPLLSEHYESSTPGLFIAGELGGLALVKNACRQGLEAVGEVARSLSREEESPHSSDEWDLVIVGSGPAGMSAALTASTLGLRYLVLEREASLGGTILHYPRRKLVMTPPVPLGEWGTLDRPEYTKEDLLEIFSKMVEETGLHIEFGRAVESVARAEGGFHLKTAEGVVRARRVLLCLGRRGTPRKLRVPGEESSKVMYRLMDAASYEKERLLVVGGGDSAIEAALGLANNASNRVTVSYRKPKFFRIKKKNQDRIDKAISSGRIEAAFGSTVEEIGPDFVRLGLGDGESIEVPNDYVFVFAGGVPPFAFLREVGVRFGGDPPEPEYHRLESQMRA